jgi:streptogramin lyase
VVGARLDAYDPARDRWRRLPRPPLPDRDEFTAVWNGRDLLVWAGDGAAFDPETNRWRVLPGAPLAARDRHAAVPLRGGMIVWAGCCRGAHQLADGAIFRR